MTKLTSDTIRELRLPLALMVVLVHVYGFWGNGDPAGFVLGGSESGSGSFVFDIIRTVVSYGLCTFAVPCFFLIAGYLFFVREEKPTMPFYGRQWCKRLFSILIPYLAWILLRFSTMPLNCCGTFIVRQNLPVLGVFSLTG